MNVFYVYDDFMVGFALAHYFLLLAVFIFLNETLRLSVSDVSIFFADR